METFGKVLKIGKFIIVGFADVNSRTAHAVKSFNFPDKETIFNMIIAGFESINNHQIFVQTDQDTVVKFEYKKINGQMFLNSNQHNLSNKTDGTSTSLSKEQLMMLFGKQA
ncbi:MAG: hypothetical protein IBX66_09880 [Lutibacter sp.]|nr:hypothetical protein [Lutibacter sp.]